MLVPVLILTVDDDPRWDALPFVLAALPVAVAVSVGILCRGPRAHTLAAPRFGVVVEAAMAMAMAILAIAPT
jgi:regulation of enolase protein 1 (concanavalin A-like superfamily)